MNDVQNVIMFTLLSTNNYSRFPIFKIPYKKWLRFCNDVFKDLILPLPEEIKAIALKTEKMQPTVTKLVAFIYRTKKKMRCFVMQSIVARFIFNLLVIQILNRFKSK